MHDDGHPPAIWFISDKIEETMNLAAVADRCGFATVGRTSIESFAQLIENPPPHPVGDPIALVLDYASLPASRLAAGIGERQLFLAYFDAVPKLADAEILIIADANEYIGDLHASGAGNMAFLSRNDLKGFERYLKSLLLKDGVLNTIAFGAVVTLEAHVPDGRIISFIEPIYEEVVRKLLRNPALFHSISPSFWEEVIAASYDQAGFDEVILTPRSGDLGRDVIAIKRGFGSVKFIEQIKAYKPDHLVTADEVRALAGVLYAEASTSKAIFTTTSAFAPRLREDRLLKTLMPFRLELIDKPALVERLNWRGKMSLSSS